MLRILQDFTNLQNILQNKQCDVRYYARNFAEPSLSSKRRDANGRNSCGLNLFSPIMGIVEEGLGISLLPLNLIL